MAVGTDFLLLYKELRIKPGCGLGEFRQAYRRRVGELHPDRVQHHLYEDAAARLSNLNAMYASAMEFHKQHGRLPGEASVYRPDPRPQTTPPQAGPAPFANPPYKNLKVFPQDITRPQLLSNMKLFSQSLGVRCTFCHVGQEGAPPPSTSPRMPSSTS